MVSIWNKTKICFAIELYLFTNIDSLNYGVFGHFSFAAGVIPRKTNEYCYSVEILCGASYNLVLKKIAITVMNLVKQSSTFFR